MEPPLREREAAELESQLALAAACAPAERRGVLRRGPEDEAAVVPQLERDARRRDAGVRGDHEPHCRLLARGELHALLTVAVE